MFVVHEVTCPKCHSPELHPTMEDTCLIRGMKVHDQGKWWSHCLVCAGYFVKYKKNGRVRWRMTPADYDESRGWFSHD